MPELDRELHTCFMTFEADAETRDMFYMVVGSIAENFRGVSLVEFQDDTILGEAPEHVTSAMYKMATSESRLTEEQREEIERFSRTVAEWTGDETNGDENG